MFKQRCVHVQLNQRGISERNRWREQAEGKQKQQPIRQRWVGVVVIFCPYESVCMLSNFGRSVSFTTVLTLFPMTKASTCDVSWHTAILLLFWLFHDWFCLAWISSIRLNQLFTGNVQTSLLPTLTFKPPISYTLLHFISHGQWYALYCSPDTNVGQKLPFQWVRSENYALWATQNNVILTIKLVLSITLLPSHSEKLITLFPPLIQHMTQNESNNFTFSQVSRCP